jgi:hypothetical protein
MTIYIAGPDGKPLAFETDADVEAYHAAQRAAEPPWLRRLREYRREVFRLRDQANVALAQRPGRSAALADIERGLNHLVIAMAEDIAAAKRNR